MLRGFFAAMAVTFVLYMIAFGAAEAMSNPGKDPSLVAKVFYGVGTLFFMVTGLIAVLLYFVWKAFKLKFSNGLLSAGMLVRLDPPVVAALTNIGTRRSDEPTFGLILQTVKRLPGHTLEEGETIPVVCTFKDGDEPDLWGTSTRCRFATDSAARRF